MGVGKGGVQLKAQTKRKIVSEWYSVPLRHCFLDGPHTLTFTKCTRIFPILFYTRASRNGPMPSAIKNKQWAYRVIVLTGHGPLELQFKL